jgi:hypothetical protein
MRKPASHAAGKGKRRSAKATPLPARALAVEASEREQRIIERPDGYHWIAPDGKQEFGPFESRERALADMIDRAEEEAPEPGETLQEAESEIGIADWIDPETGEPAEGSCPPHLERE